MGPAPRHFPKAAALVLLVLTAWGCATVAPPLPPPPAHEHGQVLWHILHDQCVPDQVQHALPAPCAVVSLTPDEAHGFVVLKDKTGVAQHLLMPTAKITGVEDPQILSADSPNYFASAWAQRGLVEQKLGHPLGREQTSVTVNSAYGRTQDQLHLHIDCLGAPSIAALASLHDVGSRWSRGGVMLNGQAYRVRWLGDAELAGSNPFRLMAEGLSIPAKEMGVWTLGLVGARRPDGAEGFYLLAQRFDPAKGHRASVEDIQDHDCRL